MKTPISRTRYWSWFLIPLGFGPVHRRASERREARWEIRNQRWLLDRAAAKRAIRTRQAAPPRVPAPVDLTERIHVYEAMAELYRTERDAAVAALVAVGIHERKLTHAEAKDEAWKAVASWIAMPDEAACLARGVNRADVPGLIHA